MGEFSEGTRRATKQRESGVDVEKVIDLYRKRRRRSESVGLSEGKEPRLEKKRTADIEWTAELKRFKAKENQRCRQELPPQECQLGHTTKDLAIKDVKTFFRHSGVEIDDAVIEDSYSIFSGEPNLGSQKLKPKEPSNCDKDIRATLIKEPQDTQMHHEIEPVSDTAPYSEKLPKSEEIIVSSEINSYSFLKLERTVEIIEQCGAAWSSGVWSVGLPSNFHNRSIIQQIVAKMRDQGISEETIIDLQQRVAPAYSPINEWLAVDIKTGILPKAEHERTVNLNERLGMIPYDRTTGKPMTKQDFSYAFQHARNVRYPVNIYPSFATLYCRMDSIGKITGWKKNVRDFVKEKRSSLPLLDSESNDRHLLFPHPNQDRRAMLENYFNHFGIKYLAGGPVIQLDLNMCGKYVVGAVEGAALEQTLQLRKYLRNRAAKLRESHQGASTPSINMPALREILYFSSLFRLSEQAGRILYHYEPTHPDLTMQQFVQNRLQGGLAEFLHFQMLSKILPDYLKLHRNPQSYDSFTILEAGRKYTSVFSNRGSNISENKIPHVNPDFVIWNVRVAKNGAFVHEAAYHEEITTMRDAENYDTDFRSMFLGLISIVRMACIDRSKLRELIGRDPAEFDLLKERSRVYKGITFRGLEGTDWLQGFRNLLNGSSIFGFTPSHPWIKIQQVAGGGIVGTARLDDGDGTDFHIPCHIWFKIIPIDTNPNRFILESKIGTFSGALSSNPRETLFVTPFNPDQGFASVWYDSSVSTGFLQPTTISLDLLKGNKNFPINTNYIDVESRNLARHIMEQYKARGSIIEKAEWEQIVAHDPAIFFDIMQRYHPWLSHSHVIEMGETTMRFDIERVIHSIGIQDVTIYPAAFGNPNTFQHIEQSLDTLYGFSRHIIKCPSVAALERLSDTADGRIIHSTIEAAERLQEQINDDFKAVLPSAMRFANIITTDLPWKTFSSAIREANKGTADCGTTNWRPYRNIGQSKDHLSVVTRILATWLTAMRKELHSAQDFNLHHPAVREFLTILENSRIEGTEFPLNRLKRFGSKMATRSQCFIVDEWFKMWARILSGHGVKHSLLTDDRMKTRSNNQLVGHFQHAIVHDWPTGAIGCSARSLNTLDRKYLRLSASMQLLLDANRRGFEVIDSIENSGYTYSKLRFKPLPGSPEIIYIARFHTCADIRDVNGAGYEVFAECTNPASSPGLDAEHPTAYKYKPSGQSNETTWTSIKTGIHPLSITQSAQSYLENLHRVQVGGKPKPEILPFKPDPNFIKHLLPLIPS